jgi:hypothetical protein
MEKQQYLMDLINRILNKTTEFDPELNEYVNFISEKAYKEAFALTDIGYIEPLRNLLSKYSSNTTQHRDIRRKIYMILEKIAVNSGDMDVYPIFDEQLIRETDKDLIGDVLLEYIYRSTYTPILDTILPLAHDKRWQERHMAIKILGRYPKEKVEEVLINLLQAAKDPYEIEYILGSLRQINSEKTLDVIEKYLHHVKGEVRASALATLKVLGGKENVPIFIEGLKDKSAAVKLNALGALLKHGDETVLEALILRLKTIVKKQRQIEPMTSSDSDVVKIMEFLLRYREQDKVSKLFTWIYEKKWNMLFDNEREWFKENVYQTPLENF